MILDSEPLTPTPKRQRSYLSGIIDFPSDEECPLSPMSDCDSTAPSLGFGVFSESNSPSAALEYMASAIDYMSCGASTLSSSTSQDDLDPAEHKKPESPTSPTSTLEVIGLPALAPRFKRSSSLGVYQRVDPMSGWRPSSWRGPHRSYTADDHSIELEWSDDEDEEPLGLSFLDSEDSYGFEVSFVRQEEQV